MRDAENHESSWDAAYSYIKKQKEGFKVSPRQAVSQITETVIRSKEEFNYCIGYLDKLHPNRELIELRNKKNKEKETAARKERREKLKRIRNTEGDYSEETFDRYVINIY